MKTRYAFHSGIGWRLYPVYDYEQAKGIHVVIAIEVSHHGGWKAKRTVIVENNQTFSDYLPIKRQDVRRMLNRLKEAGA